MEILKEISKKRLVVMVTHNPELADIYATRTVRMLDGKIVADSDPLSDSDIENTDSQTSSVKVKKPSMSPITAFGLSLRNLISKKGRTILTSFAGSIGIIGIALIFAVSQGMRNYISLVQENTLSSYPLTLEAQHISLGSLIETFMGSAKSDTTHENDAVYQKPVLYDLVNTLSKLEAKQNDLKSFKKHLETIIGNDKYEKYNSAINGVQYTYDIQLQIYTKNVDGNIIKSDTEKLIQDMLIKYIGKINGTTMDGDTSMLSMLSMSSSSSMTKLWQELLPGNDGSPINPLIEKQYDLIYGSWPNSYDEILIVVDENNEIDDMTLYSLGLLSDEEIDKIVNAAVDGTNVDYEVSKWSYAEICSNQYRVILNGNCYRDVNGIFEDQSENQSSLDILYANAVPLKVTGIIKLNENATTDMLQGTLCYTHMLTEYIIEQNKSSASIIEQLNNPNKDIFHRSSLR
jgi:putative ABC transport system permease protein